jgi:hypothetical protein
MKYEKELSLSLILNFDEDRQLELLLAENAFREKTTIQNVIGIGSCFTCF